MRTKFKLVIIIFMLSTICATAVHASRSEFCSGFKQGYVTGYKQAKKTSLKPLVPLCPLQPLKGFGDPKSDFEHGYTIGFRQGSAAAY